MKRLSILTAVLLLGIGLTGPLTSQAQVSVSAGPRLGVPVGDLANNGSLYFGADVRAQTAALPVVPDASFDYYLTDVDGTSVLTVDLNALYPFEAGNMAFTPYAGGGLGIIRSSFEVLGETTSDTEVGLNLVGGAEFDAGSLDPFVQANVTVGGDITRFGLTGGVLFSF